MTADWKKKNAGGDDALNQKAIAALARPCPNCKNPIEKNGYENDTNLGFQ